MDNGEAHHRSPALDGLPQVRLYHLLPRELSKAARGRRARARPRLRARGLPRRGRLARGSPVAPVVGAFWLVANAIELDPDLRAEITRHPNAQRRRGGPRRGRLRGGRHHAGAAVSSEVIGHSVQGRADHAHARRRRGRRRAGVLVVGCIHGNEPAGRGIVEDLARSSPAPETRAAARARPQPRRLRAPRPHQRARRRPQPQLARALGRRRRAAVVGARDARDPRPHPARAPGPQHLLPPALRPRRRARGRPPAGRPPVRRAHRPAAAAPEPAPGQHLALAERARAAPARPSSSSSLPAHCPPSCGWATSRRSWRPSGQITSASEAAAAAIASRSVGLEHALQVEHPRAERVELARADDREARHAGLPRAGRDLAGDLALQRLLVDPALADDDRARGAHARVEVQRARARTRRRARARRRTAPTARR